MFGWASGVGTACGLAVKDYLMERKIPWVGPAAGSLNWITPPQKYLFAVYPLYYTEAQILTRYAVKNLGKKRIAMAYQNDDYGKNGVQGAEKELAKHGLKLVAQVPVEQADTDMKPHVMEFKKVDADVVLLWVTNPRRSHHGDRSGDAVQTSVDEHQHLLGFSFDDEHQQGPLEGHHRCLFRRCP